MIVSGSIVNRHYRRLTEDVQHKTMHYLLNSITMRSSFPFYSQLYHLIDLPQNKHHKDTVFNHSIKTLEGANILVCRSEILKEIHVPFQVFKIAALLHDIGKKDTMEWKNGDITFYNHEVVGAKIINELATYSGVEPSVRMDLLYISKMIRHHMFRLPEQPNEIAVRRFLRRVGKNLWPDLYYLRMADRYGNEKKRERGLKTKALINLASIANSLIQSNEAIFPEDLKFRINHFHRKKLFLNIKNWDSVYADLINLVNQKPERNNNKYLTDYLRKKNHDLRSRTNYTKVDWSLQRNEHWQKYS